MKTMALACAMLMCCVPTLGQVSVGVRATIPFDFEMANRVMPAGDYVFNLTASAATPVVKVRDMNGLQAAATIAFPAFWGRQDGRFTVSFNQYNDRHFLAGVTAPTGRVNIVKSSNERTMVTSRMVRVTSTRPQRVDIVAALH